MYVSMKISLSNNEENEILSGFNPNAPYVTVDMAITYLAELLVEIYLDEKEYEAKHTQLNKAASGDILPSINQTTS